MNVSAQPANVLIYPQLVTTALKRSTSEVMPLVRVRGRQGGKGGIRFALLLLPFLKERLLFSKTNHHFVRSLFEGNESNVRLVE